MSVKDTPCIENLPDDRLNLISFCAQHNSYSVAGNERIAFFAFSAKRSQQDSRSIEKQSDELNRMIEVHDAQNAADDVI